MIYEENTLTYLLNHKATAKPIEVKIDPLNVYYPAISLYNARVTLRACKEEQLTTLTQEEDSAP